MNPKLTDSLVYELKKDGFVVLKNVLEKPFVHELKLSLEDSINKHNIDLYKRNQDKDAWMVHNLMFESQCFIDLLELDILGSLLELTLGSSAIIYAYQSSSLPAMGTNYSNRVHVDCPRFIPNYNTNMGAIFALTDFNSLNGATFFLKGSHLFETAPSDEYFWAHATQVECESGDLIFFNARTYHAGGRNCTEQTRHAVTLNFCRSFMRQRFDFTKMADEDFFLKLTKKQRRLLGYDVRIPVSLDEFYLPESQRLYKPNQG